MLPTRIKKIALAVLFLTTFWGAPPAAGAESRAWSLGVGTYLPLAEPFHQQQSLGFALPLNYEFAIRPQFSLSIHAGYRFVGELHQVSYGLRLRHYWGSREEGLTIRPYVEYGLLMLLNRLKGREGSGLSHDTELSAGADLKLLQSETTKVFVQLSYHFSRLSYFEGSKENLDCLQLSLGPKWEF